MDIALLKQPAGETVDLMSKEKTDRKSRLPVKQIDGVSACLDRCDLIPPFVPVINIGGDVIARIPRDLLLRAECRLGNLPVWRLPSNARQHKPMDADTISRSEERPNVVEAPDVVEHDDDRERPNLIVPRRKCRCVVG